MKRALGIILCAVLLCSILAGCGPSGGGAATTAPATQAPATGAPATPPPSEALKLAYELIADGDSTDEPPTVKASEKYTIGVCLPHLANPHFVGQAYGYISKGEELGVEVIVNEAGGYTELPRQLEQFEDFLSMGVDAIILVAIDGEGTVGLVDQANALEIPVINVNVMTKNENVAARIRSDDSTIGEMQAECMADALGGEGKVLMFNGPAGTSWAVNRSKAFREYMEANHPKITILEEKWLDSDPTAGLEMMEDMLQTYPGEISGVFTGSDMIGTGVANAVKAANMAGQIIITSTDTQDACLNFIREGVITGTVCQSTVYMGAWGTAAAVAVLEGKTGEMVSRYWTPLNMITKDNVDTFSFEGVSKAPAGWTAK